MTTHKCFALKCSRQVPMNMLMCLGHWRNVTTAHQRAVYRTYQEGKPIGHPERDEAVSDAIIDAAKSDGLSKEECIELMKDGIQ